MPRPEALPLLKDVANLLATTQADHQLIVSGNTDNQPIHSGQFPDNLDAVDRRAPTPSSAPSPHDGISPLRMTAAGRGAYAPIASNTTAGGRSLNRRVEILVPRVTASPGRRAPVAAEADDETSTKIPSIKPNFAPKP